MRTLESALHRGGLGPVAGVDEVGRGACAGPLVVAACVLGPGRIASLAALDDSKKLSEQAREKLFPLICRYAVAYHVVFIPSAEVDRRGVHVANIEGMRRAVAGLAVRPGYVLSDGFRVPGLPMPSTSASWSTLVNLPLRCRHATIAAAVTGPMPGRASSCSTVAVLRSST